MIMAKPIEYHVFTANPDAANPVRVWHATFRNKDHAQLWGNDVLDCPFTVETANGQIVGGRQSWSVRASN